MVIKGFVIESEKRWDIHQCIDTKALISKRVKSVDIEAENAGVGIISKKEIEMLLNDNLKRRLKNNKIVNMLKNANIFRLLSENNLEEISNNVILQKFNEGDIVFYQDDPGEKLYIIKSGEVNILKDHISVKILTAGDIFGERALLFSETRSATAVILCDSEL